MIWRDSYYIMLRDKLHNIQPQLRTNENTENGSNYIKMLTVALLGGWVID